ncbi:MAG: putative transposase protein [Candidatus Gallionella acididurans]|uniref:Putative transposase protein n=1 Tax=Candidatus Gallionella acididurans TaxID=1796491 RepID=A0A139BNN9_9PROT|nr:MAG: putative transposase protein [Candidatus Gallionella acididurans]
MGAQAMTTDEKTKQLSFAQAEYGSKKKLTRRDIFLAKMKSVVPWARLIAVIEPYYPIAASEVVHRLDWNECYACTLCSSGMDWQMKR